jgi:hypothetical protein
MSTDKRDDSFKAFNDAEANRMFYNAAAIVIVSIILYFAPYVFGAM